MAPVALHVPLFPAALHVPLSLYAPHVPLSPAAAHVSLSLAAPHVPLSPAAPHVPLIPAAPHVPLSPYAPYVPLSPAAANVPVGCQCCSSKNNIMRIKNNLPFFTRACRCHRRYVLASPPRAPHAPRALLPPHPCDAEQQTLSVRQANKIYHVNK